MQKTREEGRKGTSPMTGDGRRNQDRCARISLLRGLRLEGRETRSTWHHGRRFRPRTEKRGSKTKHTDTHPSRTPRRHLPFSSWLRQPRLEDTKMLHPFGPHASPIPCVTKRFPHHVGWCLQGSAAPPYLWSPEPVTRTEPESRRCDGAHSRSDGPASPPNTHPQKTQLEPSTPSRNQ
jgi:hypothetical protein